MWKNNTLKGKMDRPRIQLNQINNRCTAYSRYGSYMYRSFTLNECAREQRINAQEKMHDDRMTLPLWLRNSRKNTLGGMSFFTYGERGIKYYGKYKH